ncbi:MAG TPA: hypothetical protein VFM98_14130 [Ramlibacter sp.]|uniref:hypothetical protein n=1 Tax=Ramlibacter sp. TaxID=1917967 RepID=UPI002D7EBEC9|nr:hypothetical protein [Ramlibacter sp.]HET8746741.1 hypothetical protein [Ramlibacter sp.]
MNGTTVCVLFVRIDAPRRHAQALQCLLQARGADVKELERQRDRVLVRAEIALARAHGVADEVAGLTGDAAQVLSWQVRCRPAGAKEGVAA